MYSYDRLRYFGWVILLSWGGASALASCSVEPPDFGDGDGDGGKDGSSGDGDGDGSGGNTGDGGKDGNSGDGDTSETSGDTDTDTTTGEGDTDTTTGDGDGDAEGPMSCEGVEVEGACILACEAEGEVRCEGECIDPATSLDFCGATEACQDEGSVCDSDESCVLGACRLWGEEESVGSLLAQFGRMTVAIDDGGNATLAYDATDDSLATKRRVQEETWSSPHTLQDEVGSQGPPSLIADAEGNVLAIWDGNNGSGWALYRTRTESWSNSAPFGASSGFAQALVVAPSGDAYVGFDDSYYGHGTKAWTRRFGFDAEGWYDPIEHNENSIGGGYFQTLVVDGDSNVTSIWSELDNNSEVVARASHWSAASDEWSTPVDLGTQNSEYVGAADAEGNVALVSCYDGQILPLYYDRTDEIWSTQAALVNNATANPAYCGIASNLAGDMILVWQQTTPDGSQVAISRHNPITHTWQGVVHIMDLDGFSASPMIGMDAAGNAWVVAKSYDDSGSEIIARRYDAEHDVWEDEITIASVSASEDLGAMKLAVSKSGSAVVVWSITEHNPSSSTPYTLWSRAYE